ncbi:MAG: inositol monophosphatase [Muribaculaceae bacterium]
MTDTISSRTLLADARQWALAAGEIQLGYFRSDRLDIRAKLNDSDVVTAADKAAERLIIDSIHAKYPTHSILSEESGADSHDSPYRWIIDPLDGTTNFSAGLPLFSVSIGLEYRGEMLLGVVYAPYLREMFHAVKGCGAYLNDTPIHPSSTDRLSHAVVATGFPVDKDTSPDCNLDNVARVLPLVRGMRRLGSAAIDLCYVAAGYLDAYWELNLHAWDVAAGSIIIAEAGARLTHFRHDRNLSVMASNPALHQAILPLLSSEPHTTPIKI